MGVELPLDFKSTCSNGSCNRVHQAIGDFISNLMKLRNVLGAQIGKKRGTN